MNKFLRALDAEWGVQAPHKKHSCMTKSFIKVGWVLSGSSDFSVLPVHASRSKIPQDETVIKQI